MTLDTLLDAAREPHPADEAFVGKVMDAVDGPPIPWMRRLRRPIIAGVAAAVMTTGGAVAALVGTTPDDGPPRSAAAPRSVAVTSVPSSPSDDALANAPVAPAETNGDTSGDEASPVEEGADEAPTPHTSFAVDDETGLRLHTDTHTATFEAGRPQVVTLTLTNTGDDAIALTAADGGCVLQALVVPMGGPLPDIAREGWYRSFDRACAEMAGVEAAEPLVLAPGTQRTADVEITLPEGTWGVMGMCECSWARVGATPRPGGLRVRIGTLGAPLIDVGVGSEGLVTPPVRVQAT